MSSSDQSAKPYAPSGSHGGYPSTGQITVGSGIGQITANNQINPMYPAGISLHNGIYTYGSASGGTLNININANANRTCMHFGVSADRISVTFLEEEGNQITKALLDPEPQISGGETLKIQTLITVITARLASGSPISDIKPISFIRANNLERHFRFSA